MNGFVIFGYYGRGNLGDETNLRELVAVIRRINQQADITVISANPEQTARKFQVNAVAKFNLIDIVFAIWHADALIGGGGSLFQDRTSLRSLLYYSLIILLAKISRLRILMYGQGMGPLRSFIGRILSGWILSMVDLITVRDRLSIIALTELSAHIPEIYITAEPLLTLPELPKIVINHYWLGHPTDKRLKVGLIIQEDGFMRKKFWNQLLECIGWDQNIELYLIAVDPKDLSFLRQLSCNADVTLLPLATEWEELQKAIGGLDILASTRLHGLVAAVVQKVPCLGMAVDPKMEGFCLQLGVPFLRPTSKMEWLTVGNRILSYLSEPLEERRPWASQLDFWRARALENQLILKKFIS
jgi:polysaccharide pyruvyl transferase CsaB